MNLYAVNLERFNIDTYRYRELQYLCFQYPAKRRELEALIQASPGFCQEGTARGGVGDPTFRAVSRRERLLRDCEDIEQSAIAAAVGNDVMYQHLLRHVTRRGYSVDHMPCGRRQAYEMRGRFFAMLDKRRERIDS